jgi:1,2-diacylglycerol 3-alpha-glucosyltransferase
MRVAVVFDNFGPYHIARLAGAARYMDALGVEVAATSREYDWLPPEWPPTLKRVRLLDAPDARFDGSRLAAAYAERVGPWRPDAIALPGWSSMAALVGARWAAERGIPAIVMSETNAADFARHPVGEFVKRRLIELYRAGLCGGTLARCYLEQLGLAADRIFLGYDVVDNDHFARGAARARGMGAMPQGIDAALRGRYFLTSSRFVPKKNLPRLIEAFSRYRSMAGASAWPLVLLGDGEMREALERQRDALALGASLIMPGFRQYDELPLFYGTAGAFVLASTTEQWGLVVNEAMASRLPVLVSTRCGCAADLVQDDCNGFTFDPYDVPGLANRMLDVAAETCNRDAMGQKSFEIISRWSPETFGIGLRRAAKAALAAPKDCPTVVHKALLWTLAHQ